MRKRQVMTSLPVWLLCAACAETRGPLPERPTPPPPPPVAAERTPPPPSPPSPRPPPAIEPPERLVALEVAEPASVVFLSSAVGGGSSGDDPAAPDPADLPEVAYTFGAPLYLQMDLPLTLDDYKAKYGFDTYDVSIALRHDDPYTRSEKRVDRFTAHVDGGHAHTLVVSLLRDARLPADVDGTPWLVNAVSQPHRTHFSPVVVELVAKSLTPGIRPRTVGAGAIAIDLPEETIADRVEAFALLDRNLRRELEPREDTMALLRRGGVPGGRGSAAEAGATFPASKMPVLDAQALAAVASTDGADPRRPLRAAITSDVWQYARDVKAKRAFDRFVVGVAAFRTPQGRCEVESTVWMQRLGGAGSGALVAHHPRPSGGKAATPMDCAKVGA
jgi:hypothetical protein